MADLWEGARSPEWIVTRLNHRDEPLGDLLGVLTGSVEIVALARLGGSATLSLTKTDQGIDWLNDRVLISYDPGVEGLSPIPWGIWLFSSPKLIRDVVDMYEVTMLSKMVVVDEDTVPDTFTLAENTPIVATVDALIRSTGETAIALTPSAKTTTSALVWEAGTSKLTIINDLLAAADYSSLWCDGAGQFRVEPYVAPGDRVSRRTFAAGAWSIFSPGWTREQELSGIPNRVIVVCAGTDTDPAIIGTDENNDPSSPFSIPSRGRVITRRVEVTDVAGQAEANALATRYLWGSLSPVASITVTHAIVPLEPMDRVTLIDGEPEVSRDATVLRMKVSLDEFSQCEADWREV